MDCGKPAAWVFAPATVAGKVGWNIDGTPTPPVAKSAACSLNFNDGKSYSASGKVTGTATSAAIALPTGAKLHLGFWSYHDVESGNGYDKRSVLVSSDNFATTLVKVQLDNGTNEKAWTYVTIPLDALAGKSVQIRFDFDSMDGVNNDGAGWFVDDLVVNKVAP